ncbi:hypothetical protein AAVH_17589 [Aphelenchoides avenae]|nr:hypothetical protein AAVH_17589 [Aphelenchus avenae]
MLTLQFAATAEETTTRKKDTKGELQKVVIRLDDFSCGGPPSGTVRSGQSVSLLPQFASDVYGFLDRAHVGTSLVANRGLSELILKLNHLLPVHHLTCEFKNDAAVSPYTAQYY